jgi:hypothetical protein
MLSGCGNNSESNTSVTSNNLGSLSSNATSHPTDTGESKSSPLIREFDVNLLNEKPLQHEAVLHLSDRNTFKISLKTLDLLTEEKRFILIQADQIINNGLPKVISPQGYTVRLEVVDNQVIAVLKSITSPNRSDKTTIITTDSNDIVVGELGKLRLLMIGVSSNLSFNNRNIAEGLNTSSSALHQYIAYTLPSQYFTQITNSSIGVDRTISAQIGKSWQSPAIGIIHTELQHIYQYRDAKRINMLSLTYTTHIPHSWCQGHIGIAMALAQPLNKAVGFGLSMQPSQNMAIYVNTVYTEKLWSMAVAWELKF